MNVVLVGGVLDGTAATVDPLPDGSPPPFVAFDSPAGQVQYQRPPGSPPALGVPAVVYTLAPGQAAEPYTYTWTEETPLWRY